MKYVLLLLPLIFVFAARADDSTVYVKTVRGQIVEVSQSELVKANKSVGLSCDFSRGQTGVVTYARRTVNADASIRFESPRAVVAGVSLPLIVDWGSDAQKYDVYRRACEELGFTENLQTDDVSCQTEGITEGASAFGNGTFQKVQPTPARYCRVIRSLNCQ